MQKESSSEPIQDGSLKEEEKAEKSDQPMDSASKYDDTCSIIETGPHNEPPYLIWKALQSRIINEQEFDYNLVVNQLELECEITGSLPTGSKNYMIPDSTYRGYHQLGFMNQQPKVRRKRNKAPKQNKNKAWRKKNKQEQQDKPEKPQE